MKFLVPNYSCLCTDKHNQQLRRLGKEENGHRKAKVRLLSLVAVLSITTDSTLLLCADSGPRTFQTRRLWSGPP